jgi:hypothetical protein
MSTKKFRLAADQIKQLIPNMGGCFATDHIPVLGKKVGYMYREVPDKEFDSGWRFFSGEESQAYVDDSKNTEIYSVNTIANYDPAIIPYLQAPAGSAFGRVSGTDEFKKE